jgi:hypothetical protein
MKLLIGPAHLQREFNFSIPTVDKVGIFMSGGLDSAAMLSLIITELKNTERLETIPITAFTVEKPTGETLYSTRILDLFRKEFSVDINHVNNIENSKEANLKSRMDHYVILKTCRNFNGLIYLSGNNMPPSSIKQFTKGSLGFKYSVSSLYQLPFLDLLKPQMIDILYKLKLEFVIPYTHSCSCQFVGRCDSCYSCEERAWGFEQLGLPDPETIPL